MVQVVMTIAMPVVMTIAMTIVMTIAMTIVMTIVMMIAMMIAKNWLVSSTEQCQRVRQLNSVSCFVAEQPRIVGDNPEHIFLGKLSLGLMPSQ